MKTLNFKQTITALGYEVVKYSKGYNFRSAFATKDGQLYYFHLEDLRDTKPMFYYRTAESTSDYHGGPNRFIYEDELEEKGIRLVEPRRACDYNSM